MMSNSEITPSESNSEGVMPYYLFEPNENLTGIGIATDDFPLGRLEDLRGLSLPVARIQTSEGVPAAVEVKPSDIAEGLRLVGKVAEAQWWYGLDLGLTSNPHRDRSIGATVIFHLTGGELRELASEVPNQP